MVLDKFSFFMIPDKKNYSYLMLPSSFSIASLPNASIWGAVGTPIFFYRHRSDPKFVYFFFWAETPPKAAVFQMGAEGAPKTEGEGNAAIGGCFTSICKYAKLGLLTENHNYE